jgi:hypothetical protein
MSFANVQIDLSQLETDELIEEVESRDYRIMMPGEIDENIEAFERTVDEIHNLYQAFIHWKDFGMKDSTFESDLKKFFEATVDMKVL